MFASTASSNTVFSRNVSNSSGDTVSINLYYKLAKYVKSISIIFTEYTKGNFYAVSNILTRKVYNQYAIRLSNLAKNRNKHRDYETLRRSCVESLHGMYQAIQQYSIIIDLENALESSQEAEDILYDSVRLKEFIANLNRQTSVFPDARITTIAATLKPEYAEYIRLYGYPESGVFDMDKLAKILKSLLVVYR